MLFLVSKFYQLTYGKSNQTRRTTREPLRHSKSENNGMITVLNVNAYVLSCTAKKGSQIFFYIFAPTKTHPCLHWFLPSLREGGLLVKKRTNINRSVASKRLNEERA